MQITRVTAVLALWALIAVACGSGSDRPESFDPAGGMASSTFQVVAVGDFGRKNHAEKMVSEAIEEWASYRGPDALLTLGDNVYPYGSAEFVRYSWTEPYSWVRDHNLEVWGALGNHDVAGDGGEAVMEALGMTARYYSKRVGDVEFFILDGTDPENRSQLKWFTHALRVSTAQWKIAVTHFPPYSCSRGGPDGTVLEYFEPIWRDRVDLVLSGHEHNYQRFDLPGITYIVSGGGGDDLYDAGECPTGYPPRVAVDDRDFHYLVIEGDPDVLKVFAIAAEDGRELDRVVLRSGGSDR